MTATAAPGIRLVEPIAPLRSCVDARYDDARVSVEFAARLGPCVQAEAGHDGRIKVRHGWRPDELDDEIASPLAEALASVGPVDTDDAFDVFARAFVGVVVTTDVEAVDAWRRFYRNTLALLERPDPPGYSGVYRHALDLLPTTSVADLGCGFGFLALHLAARGTDVAACDVDPASTALLRRMARRLRSRIDVRTVLPARVDLPSASVDGVALLHVFEHVDEPTAAHVLGEAMRIARRRVVVAVPLETRPTRQFGHVRCLDLLDLHELGASTGWRADVHDHLGGWLVLDRPPGEGDHPAG